MTAAKVLRKLRRGQTTWQSRALKDLDEFEKAGITNADVAKIRKLLAT